jgi:hypothetical protein
MPDMTFAQVRVVDPILTTVVVGYRNAAYVGEALFPRVPVRTMGGRRIEFGKEHFLQYSTARAPGAAIKRVSLGYAGKPYSLDLHGLAGQLPVELLEEANAQPGIDLGQRTARVAMDVLLRSLEQEQAAVATNPANYPASHVVTLSGTSKWSDPASDPAAQIAQYSETVRQTIGLYPNVLLMGGPVFSALKNHPKILDRIKYTGRDSLTETLLANLWGLDRVVVGTAVYVPDPTTGAFADIWGNVAVLAYVPQQFAGIETPSYGYTYVLEGHPAVLQPWLDRDHNTWVYPVEFARAPLITSEGAGFLIRTPA